MPTLLVVEGFSGGARLRPRAHQAEIRRIRELTHEHAKDFLKRWNEHIRR